jgi:predicted HNH restriction endonuclease
MQGSGTSVAPEAAAELERRWALHLGAAATGIDHSAPRSAKEGRIREHLAKSRYRESLLRKAKIAKALAGSPDRKLRCEVPGCGFCFEEVYGKLGRRYAHVHHLEALSAAPGEVTTTIEDLAIVCANCHSMIHKGNECRPLKGLIARRR